MYLCETETASWAPSKPTTVRDWMQKYNNTSMPDSKEVLKNGRLTFLFSFFSLECSNFLKILFLLPCTRFIFK